MLRIKEIDVFYGDVQVLWGVSLEVNRGEVLALLGANGAGKSTTIKTISCLLKPKKGQLWFEDQDLLNIPPHHVITLGIVHVPEGRRLFSQMTVEENLIMGALHGDAKSKRSQTLKQVYEIFPKLAERKTQLAGTLSGGEQQMVALGRGLMSLPKLMMLDEPSLGLAPIVVRSIFEIIQRINKDGVTVLLVEQNVKQSLNISHRAYVLENGKVVLSGAGKDLLDNAHVKEAYLGI